MTTTHSKPCNHGNEASEPLNVWGDGMIFIVNVTWKVLVLLSVKCLALLEHVCHCQELDP